MLNDSSLSEKEKKFIAQYLVDYNGKRAALSAGYNRSTAANQAQRMLNDPKVKRAIAHYKRLEQKRLRLTKLDILEELRNLVTLDPADIYDENGRVKPIHDIPLRARSMITGFEQTETVDHETGETTIVTKVKLCNKVAGIDLAMKHKGMFAAEKQDVKHTLDWDSMLDKTKGKQSLNTMEAEVIENGNGKTKSIEKDKEKSRRKNGTA